MMHSQQNSLVQNDNTDGWVDTMVSCAQAVNKLFTKNTCRVCQVYSDKQVEFEQRLQELNITSPVDSAYLKAFIPLHPEVELYRQFLFDEDSVVDSVGHRETTEYSSSSYVDDVNVLEDARTLTTQRTQ